jgi:hypothetical protein
MAWNRKVWTEKTVRTNFKKLIIARVSMQPQGLGISAKTIGRTPQAGDLTLPADERNVNLADMSVAMLAVPRRQT